MADNDNGVERVEGDGDGDGDDYEDEEDIEDEEATVDEEEAQNEEDDYNSELKDLQEEGEMSIEELRRKYYGETKEEEIIMKNVSVEETQIESTSAGRRIGNLRGKFFTALATTCDSISQYFAPDELEEDDTEDYVPPELWKKHIRVGADYQVNVMPEPFTKNRSSESSSTETSEVLWVCSPVRCSEQSVVEYLVDCERIRAGEKLKNGTTERKRRRSPSDGASFSVSDPVPDDENALMALYQTGYDVEKAKAKGPFDWSAFNSINGPRLTQPKGPWRRWSEDDCANFEKGLLEYEKNFWKIQRDYLPGKTVGEIVSFYYNWKKSERRDLWSARRTKREVYVDPKSADLMGHIADSILFGGNNDMRKETNIRTTAKETEQQGVETNTSLTH